MAAGERIRQAAWRAKQLTEQRRGRLTELRRRVDDMRRELDQLVAAANEWEREIGNIQADLSEVERLATEFDNFERRGRQRR